MTTRPASARSSFPASPRPHNHSDSRRGSPEAHLVDRIGRENFSRFFDDQTQLRYDGDRLEIAVPSDFMATLLGRRFGDALKEVAREGGSPDASVDFRVEAARFHRQEQLEARDQAEPKTPSRRPARSPKKSTRYRLQDFIVGDCNRLAYNAALAMLDRSTEDCGPLFFYGGCGMGKTHLLQAVAAEVRAKYPGARVACVTAETFTNDFLSSLKEQATDRFRAQYRGLDVLCIDDVHFLASKDATQRELLQIFDELRLGGTRVLLASDEHPGSIRDLRQALASRFVAGLVARLDPPDRQTREEMIRVFARRRGLSIEDAAVVAIADRVRGPGGSDPSVRDLEGVLTRVEAVSRLLGSPYGSIGLVAVDSAFGLDGSAPAGAGRPLRVEDVIDEVCKLLAIRPEDLMGSGRHRRIVLGRSLVAFLSRELTTQSFPEIARALGRSSHSTVITAHQRFTRQIEAREPASLNAELAGLDVLELCERARRQLVARSRRLGRD